MDLQKGEYYLSLLTVAHCIFMRVKITCGVNKKKVRLIVNFLIIEKETLERDLP